MTSVPAVLDLDALQQPRDSAQWTACAKELGDVASRFGFFYVRNHGIPQPCIDRVYSEAAAFFALSETEKMQAYIGSSPNHRGYVPMTEKGSYNDEADRRFYEAFDSALDLSADDPDYAAHHHLLGPNVWPAHRPEFRAAVTDYYERIAALGRTICAAIESYLGMPLDTMTSMMRKPVAQLRVIHYLENDFAFDGEAAAMGAHTDYECITLLHQCAEGLQVFHPELGWYTTPVMEGCLVVLIGDMLEALSNGTFRSPLHRVINNRIERYSMPFFVATDFDAVIEPHSSCVSAEKPAAYGRLIAGHHLLGQLLRDFPYLRERHRRGELQLDFVAPEGNPFEHRPQSETPAVAQPAGNTGYELSLHN